ncbi:hypothetical protein BCR36DRAFT_404422 [Piromyces finnis]|uniref:DUF2238 domain-containing protein n=1 Tax=Piromyces finnis TaxID=1754191 RepID=A0A1Y1V966_9FUNG|nr:hypothetical protein BCR36DRAFT_404422 [Piromyces finnis]|eukprot:ORX50281.1 hypothetical protein BCR36DRAFT_404422 [Piromyces finnis]
MVIVLIISLFDLNVTMRTWGLECLPAIVAVILLSLTMKRFRLTYLLYTLIFIHSLILIYGGHYSYSDVPLGFWMSDLFGWKRNNYDKIGHFWQGFCPVIIARELTYRLTPLKKGFFLEFLSWSVAMMVSSVYEIFEWLCSLTDPNEMEAFLGTQGYVYDTQSDMFMCLVGAFISILIFAHIHNYELKKLDKEKKCNIKSEEHRQIKVNIQN